MEGGSTFTIDGFSIRSGNWYNQHASPSCPRIAKGKRSRRGTCLHGEMANATSGIAALRRPLGVFDPNFGFAGQLKHKTPSRRNTKTTPGHQEENGIPNQYSCVCDSLCCCERRVRVAATAKIYQAAVRSLSRCCRMWIANTSLFPPHLSARRRGRDCSS